MNINELIKEMLLNEKRTQKDLSQFIGVSTSTLNNWLKLDRSIPAEYIAPICEFFNVSCDYLLTGKEPTPKLSENEEDILSLLNQVSERNQVKIIGKVEEIVKDMNKSNIQENVS